MAQQDSEVFNGTFLNLPAVKEVEFYKPLPKKVAKEVRDAHAKVIPSRYGSS